MKGMLKAVCAPVPANVMLEFDVDMVMAPSCARIKTDLFIIAYKALKLNRI